MAANFFYGHFQFEKDVKRYSKIKNRIDSAFQFGDIIYMGESSNTSFNPWTDTLANSVSDFLQLYLPDKKITSITHESFHPGLFRKMLNLLPDDNKPRTLVITMNMRTCGPSAVYSANEAANQQEALFYSKRLPLLTRIFLSLHYYDNRSPNERERLKLRYWRTESLQRDGLTNKYKTVKLWLADVSNSPNEEKWRHMADAYIKEFGFVLDDKNPRVQDLEEMASICKQRRIRLIFHLLPENRDYAELLFGKILVQYMDHNANYLAKYFESLGVEVINNYNTSSGSQYTDQFYPTEHFNAVIRRKIARSIAAKLSDKPLKEFIVPRNNWPNPKIKQPMADTMLLKAGIFISE